MTFKLSWGIVGAGKICNDFVAGLKTISADTQVVTAVASRSLDTATNFAELFDIPYYYAGYANLAANKEINIVYIGVINTEHYNIAKLMLEHGKHVLVEKPMCMNTQETESLVKIAKEKNVFLMEGMWSRSFPVYKELEKLLSQNIIGEVLQVTANFGFPLTRVERVMSRHMGGGVMHDLGVYVLQFVQFIFKGQEPLEIKVISDTNEDGVDISAGILMKFEHGKSAVLSVNSKVHMNNLAEVMGTTGFITVPKFWCPTEFTTPKGTHSYSLPATSYNLNFYNSTGLSYEAEEIRRCLEGGLLESHDMPLKDSIQLARWRDIILQKIEMQHLNRN